MRVATYNMQGGGAWHNVDLLFTKKGVDIALLQECGQPPSNQVVKDYGGLTVYLWADRLVYHLEYGAGNTRCSTAVVIREGLQPEGYKWFEPDSAHPGRRRLLCVKVAGVYFCSLHGPASGGAAGYAEYMLGKCHSEFERFVCGGDYNCEPGEQGVISKVTISPPSEATHSSGSKWDYVASQGVVLKCAEVGKVGQSDHAYAIFEG